MTALDRLIRRRSETVPRLVRRLCSGSRLLLQPIGAVRGPWVQVRGRWVLNFVSTNYLGLNQDDQISRAASDVARRWGISLGMPPLFGTHPLTTHLEREIAGLVGQEGALVFPSTTHIALDLLPLLAGRHGVLFVDEWAYPISLEGAHLAQQRGAQLRRFRHNDWEALARAMHEAAGVPDKVVVCDGVYPAEGQPAALRQIASVARAYGAVVYVDDAHGIGLLGENATRQMPYGSGGGGTLEHLAIGQGDVLHVGSLSKAFGVPIAFVGGPTRFLKYLRAVAPSYVHSSPPAIPIAAAALGALRIHALRGDLQRRCLARLVQRFRDGLADVGVVLSSQSLFPVQTLRFQTPEAADVVGRRLRQQGIWAVLQFGPVEYPEGGVLRFVLSAAHDQADIDEAVAAISRVLRTATGSALGPRSPGPRTKACLETQHQ